MATYESINLTAYDESRRAFRDMMLYRGFLFESAIEKRAEVYEQSRRSRCTVCEMEKHVSEFYSKDKGACVQSWCNECLKAYSKVRHQTANRDKWNAAKAA